VAQRGNVPWGQDGQETHVGKPHRIRQIESQSDQSKTVPHDKQDMEAGTSEQSDAHQIGSATAPDLRLGSVGLRGQITPEETPSCGKRCAQDSGGRPMVRQKRGHSARFDVHHSNGKDQAERSEYIPKSGKQRKSVTARSTEIRPGARSTPQTPPISVFG